MGTRPQFHGQLSTLDWPFPDIGNKDTHVQPGKLDQQRSNRHTPGSPLGNLGTWPSHHTPTHSGMGQGSPDTMMPH